ncbi:hypothetical protein Tco_1175355 [Tanacetum coccineum]
MHSCLIMLSFLSLNRGWIVIIPSSNRIEEKFLTLVVTNSVFSDVGKTFCLGQGVMSCYNLTLLSFEERGLKRHFQQTSLVVVVRAAVATIQPKLLMEVRKLRALYRDSSSNRVCGSPIFRSNAVMFRCSLEWKSPCSQCFFFEIKHGVSCSRIVLCSVRTQLINLELKDALNNVRKSLLRNSVSSSLVH